MGWLGGGDFWMEDCGGVRGAGGPGFWLRVRAAATRPTSTGDCWRKWLPKAGVGELYGFYFSTSWLVHRNLFASCVDDSQCVFRFCFSLFFSERMIKMIGNQNGKRG